MRMEHRHLVLTYTTTSFYGSVLISRIPVTQVFVVKQVGNLLKPRVYAMFQMDKSVNPGVTRYILFSLTLNKIKYEHVMSIKEGRGKVGKVEKELPRKSARAAVLVARGIEPTTGPLQHRVFMGSDSC
uniref:Uncharacterized protein n=1 Tax=Timema genevievae TaxID=629358 RepID=A0A7R9JWJ6_TIMGE|nr:unnamed protein product [Timema genevievae]